MRNCKNATIYKLDDETFKIELYLDFYGPLRTHNEIKTAKYLDSNINWKKEKRKRVDLKEKLKCYKMVIKKFSMYK